MTKAFLVIFGLSLLGVPALQAQEDVFPPQAYPPARYESMASRSPFVLPSFAENVSVAENWADDFRIVGVIRMGGESVLLAKRLSTDERVVIRSEDNALGVRLVELDMSPDPRNVSAVVEMGSEKGTIRYDESILANLPSSVVPDNPALKHE